VKGWVSKFRQLSSAGGTYLFSAHLISIFCSKINIGFNEFQFVYQLLAIRHFYRRVSLLGCVRWIVVCMGPIITVRCTLGPYLLLLIYKYCGALHLGFVYDFCFATIITVRCTLGPYLLLLIYNYCGALHLGNTANLASDYFLASSRIFLAALTS
jgi:hypothetical protein